ncbi:hypothetical protein WR164_04030 [Philodulcilactobacillus myokoensis]|uniref:YbhB/YbcL family Raf kinase inhibitor-like protein n=1 Tax=Philodulcilactobacillus myokoensis TaxID=2929573 RepID=A0A9W6B1J7_9LACO|nr:YbhB/YbcL family Raf kinase inhibitor-like protein [Philodulcilactobacillus myokoensis]GLB46424.1 hypothetical protein WR164_04030 [Philodulcilactobacillus myokoensis]
MKIEVPLDHGYIADKYSKGSTSEQQINHQPFISFPVKISGVPENAKSLALSLVDFDSIPVVGMVFVHWVAANIDPQTTLIPENDSQKGTIQMTHGNNSLAGPVAGPLDPKISQHYAGPTPPDKPHDYTLKVYALDDKLPLKDGFWLNEMMHAMKGHVLSTAKFIVPAKN